MNISLTTINSVTLHNTIVLLFEFTTGAALSWFRWRASLIRFTMLTFISSVRLHWLLSILTLTSMNPLSITISMLIRFLVLLIVAMMFRMPNTFPYLSFILHLTLLFDSFLLFNLFSMLLHSLFVSKFIKFISLITFWFLGLHIREISLQVISV